MITISGRPLDRLESVLRSWEGTPRMAGQRVKGGGADCAGFVVGVMEEMVGSKMEHPPLLDAFQVRSTAEKAFREYFDAFPTEILKGEEVEPGDIILVGRQNIGKEHILFVGNGALWHCGHKGVSKTGTALQGNMRVKKILRYKDKGDW